MDHYQVEVVHAPQHPGCTGCGGGGVSAAQPFGGFGPSSPAASQRPALVSWDSYRDSACSVSLPASPAVAAQALAEQPPPAGQAPHFDMDSYLAAWARRAEAQGCPAQHSSPEPWPQPAAEAWMQQQQLHRTAAAAPVPAAQHPAGSPAPPPAAAAYWNPAAEHYSQRVRELPVPLRGGSPSSLWVDWTAVQPEDLLLADLAC
ncbi:hypothetical protein ABPG75_002795 [Micractinium tetrahymenae]